VGVPRSTVRHIERRVYIDHIAIRVRDLAASRAFYEAALAPLGVPVLEASFDPPDLSGIVIGPSDAENFYISEGEPSGPLHIAFVAEDRGQVDGFHAAAIGAGGEDNGLPGLRPHYHADYYGAYVIDPDGNNVEAVCHRPA
jgi:catechol 2,3-dioxygenase-like lactoylglutathione lyase family enzyme